MKRLMFVFVVLLCVLTASAQGDTHCEVQAVDADGYGSHPDLLTEDKVMVEGIIINRPDYMLDSTPDYNSGDLGGMWQIYIQGEQDDHAGTAIWMGQNYDNIYLGEGMYTDPNWTSELYRLSHDPCMGHEIRPGDRVRVTGLLKFYRGKTNINERHKTDPANDLTIELLESAAGLPQPEVITLDDVKDVNDDFIFDPSRLIGCEYYQGRLVRISDVNIVDCNDWGPDDPTEFQTLTIRDRSGRTFPLKLGTGPGFTEFDCPAGQIDVIGILDQESSDMWVCKDGYRIWVVNYDGNGKVLTDFGFGKNRLPGDINLDGLVDLVDFAEFAENWLKERSAGE